MHEDQNEYCIIDVFEPQYIDSVVRMMYHYRIKPDPNILLMLDTTLHDQLGIVDFSKNISNSNIKFKSQEHSLLFLVKFNQPFKGDYIFIAQSYQTMLNTLIKPLRDNND